MILKDRKRTKTTSFLVSRSNEKMNESYFTNFNFQSCHFAKYLSIVLHLRSNHPRHQWAAPNAHLHKRLLFMFRSNAPPPLPIMSPMLLIGFDLHGYGGKPCPFTTITKNNTTPPNAAYISLLVFFRRFICFMCNFWFVVLY